MFLTFLSIHAELIMDIQNKKECLQQFQQGLQVKIFKLIVFLSICFYCVYLLTQFGYTIASMKSLGDSERTYLSTLASDLAMNIQDTHQSTMHYIATTQTQLRFTSLEINKTCSSQLFLCDESTSSDFSSFELNVKYLKANSAILSQVQIHRIFVIRANSTVFFNHSSYGLSFSTNTSQILGNISEIYFHTIKSPNNKIQLEKELSSSQSLIILCSYSKDSLLCVSSFKNTIQFVPKTKNAYFLKQFYQNINQYQSLELFIEEIFNGQINLGKQRIADCIDQYPNLIMNFIDTYKGFQIHCKSDQSYFLNYFGHYYLLYVYLWESLEPISHIQNGAIVSDRAREWVIVSSNSTYFQNSRRIKGVQLKNIRVTAYIFIIFSALALLIISRSRAIIEENVIISLQIIKALSDLLKNSQEKQFTRLLGRESPPLLNFLIQYFKKFSWIQVLRKCKGKNKYKKLLAEGLQLFEEQQYVPVLKYIYCQLITLESSLIQKLFKVKELPHKRKQVGSKYEDQEKIIPIVPEQPKMSRRRNANIQLLNPDDDQLMKNISISFRENRGVRFSNDIQMIEIDQGPILRKAKFADSPLVSCQTIKNDLSDIDAENESMKRSDGNKQTVKSLKSQQESNTSLVQMSRGSRKRQSLARSRSLQSIHLDLDNIKLDEQVEQDQLLSQQQSQEEQIFNMSRDQITFVIAKTYDSIIYHYDKLLELLRRQLGVSNQDQTSELAIFIYKLTIRKYQRFYDMLLYQKQNQIERNFQQAGFEDLTNLQQSYNQYFTHELTQQAQLLKMSILLALKHPIPLQSLKDVYSKSKSKKIQIAARHLIALAAEEFHPHLDFILVKNIFANLSEEHTTNRVKQDSLRVLIRKLQRYASFWVQLQELKMVQQFYNTRHRKFYFLASLNNIKACTPALSKFYQLLDNFDLFSVYNLDEDGIDLSENDQGEIKPRRKLNSDKIKYLTDLEGFIELFNFNNDRPREGDRSSVHTIGKKRAYEKELHQLLIAIQGDEVEHCKYVVIFLGQQHNGSSGETQQSSSSASHRTQQQKMHQEITKNIEKGFFHFILIGFHLSLYPSKYGRLKKYIKLSPQLIQLQLSQKEQPESLKRLEKYLR